MTIYDLKPAFQNLLRPIVKLLYSKKVSPNQVTIFTCILSLIFSFILYFNILTKGILLIVPFFFFVRMALNAIDGMLAKEHNQMTPFGAYLNEITDVISDIGIYLAFISHPLINSSLVLTICLLSILSEFVGVTLQAIGLERRYDGPMGKSDRSAAFSVMAILLATTSTQLQTYSILMSTIIALLLLTSINRTRKGFMSIN